MSDFKCTVGHIQYPEGMTCAKKPKFCVKEKEYTKEYLVEISKKDKWCVSCQANYQIEALKESRDDLLSALRFYSIVGKYFGAPKTDNPSGEKGQIARDAIQKAEALKKKEETK